MSNIYTKFVPISKWADIGGRELMMNRMSQTDETRIQHTYFQLTFLGMLLHIVQAVIFYNLSCKVPTFYNCMSVLFYALMLYMTYLKMYRVIVCVIHIETCSFVACCVIFCGWGTGVPIYLLAMSSLVYFCPFDHKFVPYLFSLTELAVFVSLRVYVYDHLPIYGFLPKFTEMLCFLFNTFACFYIILFAAFSSNISAMVTNKRLRSENKSLSVIANSDFLTALPSRRAFMQRVETLSPDTPVIAAIGDLDNFKNINDSYGHAFGDYVLRTVGHMINSECSQHAFPCRWGGEEFIILWYNCSPSEAVSMLHNLRSRISSYIFKHEEQEVKVTITFGAYPGLISDGVEKLIDEADKYLYKGKQHGKNCVSTPPLKA